VFYLNAAGQLIVGLNTKKVAADLLDRHAARATSSLRKFSAAAWPLCLRITGHCAPISDHIRLFLTTA